MSLYKETVSYQSFDEQHCLDYVMQNFFYYLKTHGNNETKIMGGRKITSRIPKVSSSIHSYLNYRRNIHNKLAEINANVSSMIIDSFRGIDTICLRVRQCISENENISRVKPIFDDMLCESEPQQKVEKVDSVENLTKRIEEVNLAQSISRSEYYPKLLRPKNKLTAAKLARKIKKRNELLEEFRETIIENIKNDDYEMMEKIVENLNEEIESFTIDTEVECNIIHCKSKHLEQKETQTQLEIEKSTRSNELLMKSNSTLKVEMPKMSPMHTENLSEEISDFSLMKKLPFCENSVIPEVYSRPGITDINKKLITQLEANDSFICFQRLMGKNKRKMNKFLKNYPKPDIIDIDSVSFVDCQDTISKISSRESCRSQRKSRKPMTKKSTGKKDDLALSSSQSISRKSISKQTISPNSVSGISISNKLLSKKSILKSGISISNRSVSQKSIAKSGVSISSKSLSKKSLVKSDGGSYREKKIYMKPDLGIKYSDSLWFSDRYMKIKNNSKNEKSSKRVRKVSSKQSGSQMKNRRPKTEQTRTSKNSLADCLNDDDTSNSKCATGCFCGISINNDLPSSSNTKCRLRWMRAKSDQTQVRKLEFLDILDDLTPKDLLPLHSEYPRKDIGPDNKNVEDTYLFKLLQGNQDNGMWKHLLQPSLECTDSNCTCCLQKCEKAESRTQNRTSESKVFSRETALEKLSPYIQKPQIDKKYFQFVTILPVRVYYDRYKTNEKFPNQTTSKSSPIRPQKLPLLPIKEVKGVDRARWISPRSSNPMKVVYDNVRRKNETTSIITPANKLMVNSARQQEGKIAAKKETSKSFSPKGFGQYCSTENQKSVSKQSYVAANKKLEKYIKIQTDIEKKSKDFQDRSLIGLDKKLWANKYGKGVGHQLVSFIKNQPNHPTIPLPRYARVAYKNKDIPRENMNFPRASIKNNVRHKQVLAHLQGLKEQNDEIQNNLQKAINVIEAKMIDILNAPKDSSSVEAFDVMEKEITNVLSMMKFNSKGSSRKQTPKSAESSGQKKHDKLESDFNSLSDQLFKKLERILDSEISKGVTSTSDSDKSRNKGEQNKPKRQIPLSPNKNSTVNKFRSLSATSTSLDENVQKISNFSKRPNKNKGGIARKSKLGKGTLPLIPKREILEKDKKSLLQKLSDEDHTINRIERDYATGECFSVESAKKATTNHKTVSQEFDETDNSKGDCIRQDISTSNNLYLNSNINYGINLVLSEDKSDLNEPTFTTEIVEQITEECNANTEESINADYLNTVEEEKISVGSEEKLEETIANIEDIKLSEECCQMQYDEPVMLPSDTLETETEETDPGIREEKDPGISEEVNKIIKRVEDIYTHLDDIQFSNDDHIPVFRDTYEVPNVHSQEFLTPFMQAVKAKRTRPDTPRTAALHRSPSYYNVLSFLDTLSYIQQEKPLEVHTTRLCYYCLIYHIPEIFYQAKLEFPANLKEIEKPSCLKKISDESKSKQKKVSFLVLKENKSCQVEISSLQNTKALKVSSQQFPPISIPEEAGDNPKPTAEISNELKLVNSKDQLELREKNVIVLCEKNYQCDYSLEIDHHSSEIDHHSSEINHHTSEINHHSSEINLVPVPTNYIKDIYEKTKSSDKFEIDKFTQVFCQMQTNQTEKPSTAGTEIVNENNISELKCCEKSQQVSEVSDESKSSVSSFTDPIPQIQVFYNQSDANIPKLILQNQSTGEYGPQTIVQVKNSKLPEPKPHPKIVVFREVLDTKRLLQPLKHLDINFVKTDLEKHQDISQKFDDELVESHKRKDDDREILLKSVYAIVYILMFTALNLEYRCP
nr:uncharacterized protein LOC111502687 isoform X1 [Leptinotarsa decemlineata]